MHSIFLMLLHFLQCYLNIMTIVTMLTFIFEYYSTEKGIFNGRKIYIHPLMMINIKTISVYENYLLNSLEPSSQNKKAYPNFFSQRIG